jgi:restriction system protein
MTAARQDSKKEGAKFLRYFGPLLDALRELGGSGTPDEVVERIALDLKISDEVQNELLPSGEPRFRNQVAWARLYLVRDGLIDSSKRGIWSLTERGRATKLSLEDARAIRTKWVRIFQERRLGSPAATETEAAAGDASPEPEVAKGDYASHVIKLLRDLPPAGFERFSQRLLREAGFVQVVVTGKTGDGGIDGHGSLQVGPLLSLKALFQCKRYKGSVSASDVRDFRGAMAGRTDRGIIITTGTFTAEARREGTREGVPPIELIDSERLVDMLKSLELGLKSVTTYEIDESFFEEFKT